MLSGFRSRNSLFGLVGIILALSVAISGCGTPAQVAEPVAEAAPITQDLPADVDARTVDQVRTRDDVVILDVREDWEYASGHVPGATWIPLGQLANRLDEIPQDKTVIAVCRSGNRSSQATQLLRQQGFDAHNMLGGMISWERAGLEIEK
jgi:rhodanese-related sulfurtransferase